ncbi:hypothetical protein AVEN_52119-1 [Araneus ventricosus]|uniref:Uncharacterized protein n=1 Tax=Araneus ventricosus TaxID=182803 RepID=A0A4Y2E407_ARAVE|nr:hypothetical protein AVEN_52119-1 [Araneus ventricosus]
MCRLEASRMVVGDGTPGQQRILVVQLGYSASWVGQRITLVAPRQTALLGQQSSGGPTGYTYAGHQLEAFLMQNLSLKNESLFPYHAPAILNHPEDCQATPNPNFKTGKGTVRIKTFLAKESKLQLEPQWIERAIKAHILPNQNEAALSLTKERVSTLIGKKGILRNLLFPVVKVDRREACQIHLVKHLAGSVSSGQSERRSTRVLNSNKHVKGRRGKHQLPLRNDNRQKLWIVTDKGA